MIYIAFLLSFIAGFCEGVMDTLQFHFSKSIFSTFKHIYYWDPIISWRSKYRNNDPLLGPRFPLSTTFFVGVTDGWHTFKLLRNILIFTSLPIIGYFSESTIFLIIAITVCRTVYGAGFWLSYYKILIKK